MHRFRIVVIALAALVLLSACEVRVRQSTSLREDGSGQVALIAAADEEFRQAIASFGGVEGDNPFEAAAADLPEQLEWTEYDQDGFLGIEVRGQFGTIEEYDLIVSELGDIAGLAIPFPSLAAGDGLFTFTAEIPEFDEEALAGIGSGTGFDLSTLPLDDLFDIRISARLPGELVEHNADEVTEDGQVAWNLGINSGPLTLSAMSEASSFPWWIVAVAALVVFALAVFFIRRRGAGPSEPDADTTTAVINVDTAPD